ncbi:ZIP family metal transporter [Oscillatoria salina]|uniref:ZIP family metal transporter n=1 Tax=Oscillatoria salina TaxID=331517 RepID=UPI0013BE57A4|nr:ZIP family metal transporter [Oscillatoria salina]MBZ8178773.1 ZIP family metal transporter [Oscillatoria salina IIICB1]NET90067.1 ZIP family metal transporter [Kamptonema sp. SIO1D9]
MNPILAGVIASAIAGLATFIGALPVILPLGYIKRAQGAMLGFGGGVMLAATAFSLIVPGKDAAIAQGASQLGAAGIIVFGVILGGAFLKLTHHFLPHEHFFHRQEGKKGAKLRRIWLFIFAITMHNFPEGLAVGVNFGSGDFSQGIPLAIGIGLQNLPEGLVVALSLVGHDYSIFSALGISLLTGLVEPIGGLIGAGVVTIAQSILPWAMSFAAGAMLFVISDDIIPESHQYGREQEGTLGIMAGFAVMTFLDIGLG